MDGDTRPTLGARLAASRAYTDGFSGGISTACIVTHIKGRARAIVAMVCQGTPHADAVAYINADDRCAMWRASIRANRAERAAWLAGDF
jgi:hypothetical protein